MGGGSSPTPTPSVEYLIDTSTFTTPGYIDKNNGSLVTSSSANGWSATNFIAVNGGEVLKIASPISWDAYNVWYDSNQTFISNFKPSLYAGYNTITVPSGASYMRLSSPDQSLERTMIWRDNS
jgi:hypothetical protein